MQIPATPFQIIAFAPFLPSESVGNCGTFQPLAVRSADHGLAALHPSLYIPLPRSLSPEGGISLEFSALDDFEPASIISRTPWLKALRDIKDERTTKVESAGTETSLDSILSMVELPGTVKGGEKHSVDESNEADIILSGVLNRICDDEDFRRMLAAWQGVAFLFEKGGAERLRLYIVPVARETAVDLLESCASFLDNDPPDLILLDVPFDSTPIGIRLLESASRLAERLISPVICWCGPDFLQLDDWSGMKNLPYLPNHLDGFTYAGWNAQKGRPAAFWTIAACNRFQPNRVDYDASPAGKTVGCSHIYLAPVWAVAALTLQAFARTGSPTAVSRQILHFRDTSAEPFAMLETSFSDDRSHQLVKCGLLPLMPISGGDGIRLASAVTINGEPFLSPLTLSTIIHTLIGLRQNHGPCDNPESLAASLHEAFSSHPRLKGAVHDGTIEFRGSGPDSEDRVRIEITVDNRKFGARIINFTFDW